MLNLLAAAAPALLGNNNPVSQLMQAPAQAASQLASQALGVLLPQGGSSSGITF